MGAEDGRARRPGVAPAVLLLGPTASGKSAVSLEIAARFPVEIVSVDSALVYRAMDIGTAKPSLAERARVPHHLIDIVEPTEAYSAARFAQEAAELIERIRARGRLPLLVGGTMLYARALVDGLHALPGAHAPTRLALEEEAARAGWPAMHASLARVDPATAARLEPTDAQRIQRALEIHRISGRSLSDWLAKPAVRAQPPGGFLTIALEPSRREVLHHRIAARFEQMVAAGLLDEVVRLRSRGDLDAAMPSMRCVGYRQAWAFIDQYGLPDEAMRRDPGAAALAPLVATGVAATRQLAKRQLTWLRSMATAERIDCLAEDLAERVIGRLARAWG
ncbi:MAG: tRNA (adenosine(37)-N6)-dimethylallyltransferase MiaA [Burkholderiaceae bacterium]